MLQKKKKLVVYEGNIVGYPTITANGKCLSEVQLAEKGSVYLISTQPVLKRGEAVYAFSASHGERKMSRADIIGSKIVLS